MYGRFWASTEVSKTKIPMWLSATSPVRTFAMAFTLTPFMTSNAAQEPRPEVRAQQTLEGIGSVRWLGVAYAGIVSNTPAFTFDAYC